MEFTKKPIWPQAVEPAYPVLVATHNSDVSCFVSVEWDSTGTPINFILGLLSPCHKVIVSSAAANALVCEECGELYSGMAGLPTIARQGHRSLEGTIEQWLSRKMDPLAAVVESHAMLAAIEAELNTESKMKHELTIERSAVNLHLTNASAFVKVNSLLTSMRISILNHEKLAPEAQWSSKPL